MFRVVRSAEALRALPGAAAHTTPSSSPSDPQHLNRQRLRWRRAVVREEDHSPCRPDPSCRSIRYLPKLTPELKSGEIQIMRSSAIAFPETFKAGTNLRWPCRSCSVSAECSALYPLAFGPLLELARQGWRLLLTSRRDGDLSARRACRSRNWNGATCVIRVSTRAFGWIEGFQGKQKTVSC